VFRRIAGDAASSKDIHSHVSQNIKKNFARTKWKVRVADVRSVLSSTINRILVAFGRLRAQRKSSDFEVDNSAGA